MRYKASFCGIFSCLRFIMDYQYLEKSCVKVVSKTTLSRGGQGNLVYKIEDEVDNIAKANLQIEGYSMEEVAYHCAILYEGGYIHAYKGEYVSNQLYMFTVARLTWKGHDLLDKIREDTVWNKAREVIKEKALPNILEVIKWGSTTVISSAAEGAMRGQK